MKDVKKSTLIYTISITICGIFTLISMFSNYSTNLVPTTIGALLTWELIAVPCFISTLKNSTQKLYSKIIWGLYVIVPLTISLYILTHL